MNRYMLVLRRVIPLLVLFFTVAAADAAGQNLILRFPAAEMTVGESFELIRKQTGYRFSYSSKSLDADRIVRLSNASMPIEKALGEILAGTGFTYSVQGRYILVQQPRQLAENEEPAKSKQIPSVVSRTGDVYVRSSVDMLNNVNRRKPVAKPMIEVVDTTRVMADNVRSANTDHFTSFVVPVESYMDNTLPKFAVKVNLLHGLATLTPNIALEFGLGRRTTLEFTAALNAWKLQSDIDDNKKLAHLILRPELRYWTCERFNGHFLGANVFFAHYNVGGYDIMQLFEKEYRCQGIAAGGGLTYGYHLPLSTRWALEFNLGVGAMWMKYDKFDCTGCERSAVERTKTYFGPTRAGVTLVFNIR